MLLSPGPRYMVESIAVLLPQVGMSHGIAADHVKEFFQSTGEFTLHNLVQHLQLQLQLVVVVSPVVSRRR